MYSPMSCENQKLAAAESGGRLLLKGGYVVDPANQTEGVRDLLITGDRITESAELIQARPGDRVIDCCGLDIWPGLIDMHLHICDLYEVHTNTAYGAVQDGVTTGLSPGAGNTFMTPALLGAEVDRGLPINAGVYLGGANVLASMLDRQELIALFRGELADQIKAQKLSRNWITNQTAQYAVGIKEHMGHYLMPDDRIEQLIEIAAQAGMILMTHTQDIEHTRRVHRIADGRPIHLGHANAVGCGTHGNPAAAMKEVTRLCREPEVTGEFVTTMLRAGRGSREGLQMDRKAQDLALQALADGAVDILVSDGQNQSTMKGFGDTRDNIPCIIELAENGVLSRSQAVAAMTANPARLLCRRTGNQEWLKYGTLAAGAFANVAVVDRADRLATYVITNGRLTAFENRYLRSAGRAGYWVSRFGTKKNMGVGELPMYTIEQKGE